MNNRELSEINFGLILSGRQPVTLYKSDWFATPYDKGVEILLQKDACKEDVAKVISSAYLNDAHDSVKRMNGLGEEMDWAKALQDSYINTERGKKFQKLGKRMENNEEVDILPMFAELSSVIASQSSGLLLAKDVDYKNYKPFKKCGYAPIDNTLGGIPSDGPIIVYGLTGVGKSTWSTAVINGLLHLYKDETAAIYTLEMNAEHWMWRSMNLFPSMKDVLDRLYVSGSVKDIEELIAEITVKRVNYVILDDMDNLVKSSDASEYERIYRRVKEICRFMGIPVFVLCQPNRVAKVAIERGERFLGKYDVAWSGAAENSAALQVALQRVESDVDMEAETFPTDSNPLDYIIFWKSRDGWPADRDPHAQRGPGAVVMTSSPDWNGKPYSGKWKIWSPDSSGKSIGKKKDK